MTYQGHVQNGVIVLDENVELPEGTQVQIVPIDGHARKTLSERFRNIIGAADNLPEDMAAQHDHYIHGTPKQS